MQMSEALIKEHKLIRRALAVLENMADRAEHGTMPDRHDINALLLFLHYFADECHQAKEETILFPALERSGTTFRGEASVRTKLQGLIHEHSGERSLIEETQRRLFSDTPSDFLGTARSVIRILYNHSIEEEKKLFPLAEQVLTPDEAAQVTLQMEQADAKFGRSQLDLLIQMLEGLEKQYLPKVA
jgi:hemerythrin-like domain-containing protein